MIKQLLFLLLVFASVYLSGGAMAFGPFFHIEAILLVFGGTFLLTWAAYPAKEIFNYEPLRHAGKCAVWLGVLTTVLDLMVRFWTDPGFANLSLKLASSLAGIFYGVLLSMVIIAPIAARAKKLPNQ